MLSTREVSIKVTTSKAEEQFTKKVTGAKVSATTTDSVTLKWDNPTYAAGVVIRRYNETTGKYDTIAKLGTDKTSYTDKGLDAEKAYKYVIYTYKLNGTTTVLSDEYVKLSAKTQQAQKQAEIIRYEGSNRFLTAVEISKASFPSGAKTVVLAYGMNYADALAGVSLAKAMNAPILLTNLKAIPNETLAEIKRLGAKNVIILGGIGAVSADVEKVLKKSGLKTERIAGATRFETATKIAERLQILNGKKPQEVFFVYAFNSADALSVSAVAAVKGAPVIYLKTMGDLDEATSAYLKSIKGRVNNAYVIGGDGVISNDMMKKAGKALGVTAKRVFGKDRFETCVAVNTKFKSVLNGDTICVATGMDFPDALAGGVFAAMNKAPLFLVNGKAKTLNLSDLQAAYLKTKAAKKICVLGGTGAVPDSHALTIADAG